MILHVSKSPSSNEVEYISFPADAGKVRYAMIGLEEFGGWAPAYIVGGEGPAEALTGYISRDDLYSEDGVEKLNRLVCDLGPRQEKDAPEKKTATSFSPERTAELFENAVSAALELYRGEDCYSMLHGSFGLTIREIREHGYLSDQELCDICQVPQQMLEGGMRVRDVLQMDGVSESASLAHKDSTVLVPLEDLEKLTASGQEDFAALLDARVADIRVDDREPELVLEGIEAKELERFCDALEAHEQAEQAMGDMTP